MYPDEEVLSSQLLLFNSMLFILILFLTHMTSLTNRVVFRNIILFIAEVRFMHRIA